MVRQKLVALLTRRYPFFSGCGTFANSSLIRVITGESHELVWARAPGGTRLLVPLDDYVGRAIYYVGDLDRKITWVCRQIVRQNDTVLDVGAHLGLVTIQLAMQVGQSGSVHSFEPNPTMLGLLSRSLEWNQTRNVHLYPIALGAQEDELELSIPPRNAGQASLLQRPQLQGVKKVRVRVRPFSAVAKEAQIAAVRLMKIDVEGYETQVLRGAVAWLSTNPPDAILFEVNKLDDLTRHPAISLLSDLAYAFFCIPRRFVKMRILPLNPAHGSGPRSHHDLLAVRRDRYEEMASLLEVRV